MYGSKSDQLVVVHVVGSEAALCLVNFDVSCIGSILCGGRIESDFDMIEIILVGSLLYRIMDSSHKTNMLV